MEASQVGDFKNSFQIQIDEHSFQLSHFKSSVEEIDAINKTLKTNIHIHKAEHLTGAVGTTNT